MTNTAIAEIFDFTSPVGWHRLKHYIEDALASGDWVMDIDDVLADIAKGQMQWWPGEDCAAVTQIVNYPKSKALRLVLGGGNLEQLLEIEKTLVIWAISKGCDRAEIAGRIGWGRVFRDRGYKEHVRVYSRVIKERDDGQE